MTTWLLTISLSAGVFGASEASSRDKLENNPPALTWAGLYMGINFGGALPSHVGERFQAGSGFTSAAFDLYPANRERPGATFGLIAGYGWQFGPWAVGVGGDLNFLDGRGGSSGVFLAPPVYWPLRIYVYTLNYARRAKYFASFRTRVGYAFDRTLVYVTEGVAAGGAQGPTVLAFSSADPERRFTAIIVDEIHSRREAGVCLRQRMVGAS
jgi:high affinity Mn2+ porin